MNIYIVVDIEGISGIFDREQTTSAGIFYEDGRDLMTAEVNACADACKAAGAEYVYVRDAHGNGSSIRYEALSDSVDHLIQGAAGGGVRFAGIEDCDAVILLGYHAMSGVEGAVLSHTMSRDRHYFINGVEFGETAIDAAIAAEYGKPVIMVSGDDKACAEAKHFLPWVTTCEVKRGLGRTKAMLLGKGRARRLVAEKTREAIARISECDLFRVTLPMTVRLLAKDSEYPDRTWESRTMEEALGESWKYYRTPQ